MTDIVNWFPAAADNTMQPPDGLPEHCLPSAVNDWARENMAAVRRWYGNSVLNVRNFGAIGDGLVDDTAAIQSAVTEAADKSLFFPPGNYLVRDTIALPDASIRLFGDSMTITADVAINWPLSAVSTGFSLVHVGTEDVHIAFEGMGFVWQVSGTGSILYSKNVANITVKDCSMQGGTVGVQIDRGVYDVSGIIEISGNTIFNFDGFGLYLNGNLSNLRISNNQFVTTYAGLHSLTTCIYYTGLMADGSGGIAQDAIISNNHFRFLAEESAGIWINGHASAGATKDLIISNNQFLAQGYSVWGVLISGTPTTHHIQVVNNFFEGGSTIATQAPAVLAQNGTSNVQIQNNMAVEWDAGTQGVFSCGSDNGIVSGNIGFNCSSPFIYTISGTDLQVFGNNDGSGDLKLGTESGTAISIIDPGGTIANRLEVIGANSGIGVTLRAAGSDTDVYLALSGQGNGGVLIDSLGVAGQSSFTGAVQGGQFNMGGAAISGNLSVANTTVLNATTINGFLVNNAAVTMNSNLAVAGTSTLIGQVIANHINAGDVQTTNTVVIGEGLSVGINHVNDFALYTDPGTGNTTVQFGSSTFFTYVRATGRIQLYVLGVFQQQWPA